MSVFNFVSFFFFFLLFFLLLHFCFVFHGPYATVPEGEVPRGTLSPVSFNPPAQQSTPSIPPCSRGKRNTLRHDTLTSTPRPRQLINITCIYSDRSAQVTVLTTTVSSACGSLFLADARTMTVVPEVDNGEKIPMENETPQWSKKTPGRTCLPSDTVRQKEARHSSAFKHSNPLERPRSSPSALLRQ